MALAARLSDPAERRSEARTQEWPAVSPRRPPEDAEGGGVKSAGVWIAGRVHEDVGVGCGRQCAGLLPRASTVVGEDDAAFSADETLDGLRPREVMQ